MWSSLTEEQKISLFEARYKVGRDYTVFDNPPIKKAQCTATGVLCLGNRSTSAYQEVSSIVVLSLFHYLHKCQVYTPTTFRYI